MVLATVLIISPRLFNVGGKATRDNIVRGLEAHHVHYTYMRDIRGSGNHTSELVKRGRFLEKDFEISLLLCFKYIPDVVLCIDGSYKF